MRSSWVRAIGGLLTTAIAIVAIAIFIFLIFVPGCTQTRFEVFAPAPYSDGGMPPYPFAQQDREAFRTSVQAGGAPEQLKVDQSKPGIAAGAGRSPLFLYVTALAGRTDRGVVLYSMDSGPDEPEAALPLDQLWEYLASKPRDQKKILAIDIARGPTDARWGQFVRPSVATPGDGGTPQLVEAANRIPNLAVLMSAAPGETSWTSPVLARSAFAYFLMRALAGEADGVGGTARDYRITLEELHTFLLMHVNQWVLQNRDLRGQHPLLLFSTGSDPEMRTMVLGEVGRGSTQPAVETPRAADGASLRRLESLWEARDKWSSRGPVQSAPLEWAKFQEHLRRAESWRLAGQTEGMAPHLDEAEVALRNLETQSTRSPYVGLSPFITAGLSRRTGGTPASTDPLLPEDQLTATLKLVGPEGLDASVKASAARLRTTAEQASWQPHRTRLWTGRLLDSADESRRFSEDLLFVGNPATLDRARSLQSKADEALTSRAEIVRELSESHALRARLFSELPALATWASERMPVESLSGNAMQSLRFRLMNDYSQGIDESRFRPQPIADVARAAGSSDDAVLQQTETDLLTLFEQTRQLARLLDRELTEDRDYSANSGWRTELQSLRRALTDPNRGLDSLQSRLTRHAKGLVGATAGDASDGASGSQPQYFHWLRVRNALQWNGLSTELRKSLFADFEQSDRTLHSNSQKIPVGAAAPWNGDDWTGLDGCWRSLWALQSLSLGMSDTAMHEHWVDWKNAVVDPARQVELLVELGQSVRREYRGRIDRAQPSLAERMTISDVEAALLSAIRAERTFHGYDAVLFSTDRDPLRRFERVDLAALCISQAGRYADDFWGKSGESEPEHWFVQAAEQCLRAAAQQSDAISLAAVATARENAAKRLSDRRSGRLQLALPPDKVDLSLTTQRATTIGMTRNQQVPPGIASLWVTGDGDSVLKVSPSGRQGADEKDAQTEWTIRKERVPPAGMCGEIVLRPKLLYRGRFWDDDTRLLRINPCPPEALEFEFTPPPATGKFVVHGADRRDTIFILDCSFSMTDPMDPKNKGGDTRFQSARKALTEALRVLRDSPAIGEAIDPYVIGLMAYGHRARTKGGDYFKTETNPDWKQAIPAAVSDDWRNDFELLSPPVRLVDEKYQQMLAQLQRLQPFGQTPLLGAINSATRTLLDRQRGGVVVAITDGAYNDEKREGARFKALQDLFESHPELSLHIVAFGVGEPAELSLLAELAARTQGKFYQAPTGSDLATTISTVMKPRQYSVARAVAPREETFANLGNPVENRPLRNYVVKFPGFADLPVTVFGGELLQFDLDFSASRLKPRRPPLFLFRRAQGAAKFDERDPTRLGYLRADYDNMRRVATLELGMDRDDLLGSVDRPAELRLKIVSRGDRRRPSRSWRLSPDRSIPAWLVELKDWPPDSQPEIEALWKMTRTAPDQQMRLSEVLSAPQTAAVPGWPNRAIAVAAEQQPGRVLVRLQADPSAGPGDISDVRVELGQLSMVEGVFLPQALACRSRLYEKERQITWEFEIPDGFKPDDIRIGLTSGESLDRDARRLESPLVVEKWDREL